MWRQSQHQGYARAWLSQWQDAAETTRVRYGCGVQPRRDRRSAVGSKATLRPKPSRKRLPSVDDRAELGRSGRGRPIGKLAMSGSGCPGRNRQGPLRWRTRGSQRMEPFTAPVKGDELREFAGSDRPGSNVTTRPMPSRRWPPNVDGRAELGRLGRGRPIGSPRGAVPAVQDETVVERSSGEPEARGGWRL
jgi:hypothetical protein